MLQTRTRKILRDIWARKARTVLVAIAIFVGVFGLVTLASVGQIMVDKFNEDIQPERLPMLWVGVEAPDRDHDPYAFLERLRDRTDATVIEGETRNRMFWRVGDETLYTEAILRSSSAGLADQYLEPLQLIEGDYPAPGANELIIERKMAERQDLGVGDEMVVRVLGTPGVEEQTFTIVGVVFHPYVFEGDQAVYADFSVVAGITGRRGFDRVTVRYETYQTALEHKAAFLNAVRRNTSYDVNWDYMENPDESDWLTEIHQWTDTITILSIVALVVSSFLVVTVINSIVVEQRGQIGVMKSLGATRWNVFTIYIGIALMYGLLGTVPGVLLGIPAGYYLTLAVADLANLYIHEFTIAPNAIVMGGIMGLAVPVFAALIPVILGTRVTIIQAIMDLGISAKYGTSRFAHWLGRLPLPLIVRQALANISRKKFRLMLTGFTLTLAVGAFMGVLATFWSLGDLIDDVFGTYNIELGFEANDDVQDWEAVAALVQDNVDGIGAVHRIYDAGLDFQLPDGGYTGQFVVGWDTTTDTFRLEYEEGNGWDDDTERTGIVLTKSLAEIIGVGAGDTVNVRTDDGARFELEVIGIEAFPFELAYMRWQELSAMYEGEAVADEWWVQLSDGDATVQDVDDIIKEIRQLLVENGVVTSFFNQVADEEENNNTVLTVGLIFNIASGVMAMVGGIGLLVTLFIAVYERQREIGVMRSVGAGSGAIAGQFLVEGVLVGVIAWVLGVPLSFGLNAVLKDALPLEGMPLSYPPITLAFGLLGITLVATISSLWPSLAASRKTVSNILRYQ